MSARRLLAFATSLRTTIAILCTLAALLLLNIVVPQATTLGEERFASLVAASAWNRLVLETLGLGRLPTSPLFVVTLSLFFLQLAIVLLTRVGPTWRRAQARPAAEAGLKAWAQMKESLSGPLPGQWDHAWVATVLKEHGFLVKRVGERTFWGVKHRTAPLGFLLFHLSFFLICGGGTLIYYTRFVGTAVLAEGQDFSGEYKQVLRQPPVGSAPELQFSLEEADPRFERGEPTHLSATFRVFQAGTSVRQEASVNHPVEWGPVRILVEQAGLAPVLWLQDDRGYTLDRVAVAAVTRGEQPTEVMLAGGRYRIEISPWGATESFPRREQLRDTATRLAVWSTPLAPELAHEAERVFEGELRAGEAVAIGKDRLVLQELRYWVGVRVVSERGGSVLIAGFVALIVGLTWRMLLYRREVALTWDAQTFHLVGRSEQFSTEFRRELATLFEALSGAERVDAVDASAQRAAGTPNKETS